MTFLSKGFGLYAAMDWGLRDIRFLSPQTFSGKKDGRTMSFFVHLEEYDEDFTISIPHFDTEFLIAFIPNKEGDNCVILTHKDASEKIGCRVEMTWISQNLKRKWNANLKAADILANT